MDTRAADSEVALVQRVVFYLLRPSIRLASSFGIPLKELTTWLQVGYFDELREAGLTVKEAADRLDVSMRTAARISHRSREQRNEMGNVDDLAGRIELLVQVAPMLQSHIVKVLSSEGASAVDRAIAQLLVRGRIRQTPGAATYEAVPPDTSSNGAVEPKLSALETLLSTLSNAVFGRFFARDDRTFARTLGFRIKTHKLMRLRRALHAFVQTELGQLDSEAQTGHDDEMSMNLTVLWAPSTELAGEYKPDKNEPE